MGSVLKWVKVTFWTCELWHIFNPRKVEIQKIHKISFSKILCNDRNLKESKSDTFFIFKNKFDYAQLAPLSIFSGISFFLLYCFVFGPLMVAKRVL